MSWCSPKSNLEKPAGGLKTLL